MTIKKLPLFCGVTCPTHIEPKDVSHITVPHELWARVESRAKKARGIRIRHCQDLNLCLSKWDRFFYTFDHSAIPIPTFNLVLLFYDNDLNFTKVCFPEWLSAFFSSRKIIFENKNTWPEMQCVCSSRHIRIQMVFGLSAISL